MFQSVKNKEYIAQKLGIPFESLSDSYLRAETVLAATAEYKFEFQFTKAPVIESQQLLQTNDLFVVTHIALMLKKVTTAGLTAALQGAAKLYNYPNGSIFVAANEAANLEAVYNGFMSFEVDRKKVIPAMETRNFLRIPDTQGGATQAAIAGPVEYKNPRDGFPNSLYGYYPSDVFQFDGQQTLTFKLNLSGAIDLTAALQTNYVVLMFKGYLAQDQAKNVKSRDSFNAVNA